MVRFTIEIVPFGEGFSNPRVTKGLAAVGMNRRLETLPGSRSGIEFNKARVAERWST